MTEPQEVVELRRRLAEAEAWNAATRTEMAEERKARGRVEAMFDNAIANLTDAQRRGTELLDMYRAQVRRAQAWADVVTAITEGK